MPPVAAAAGVYAGAMVGPVLVGPVSHAASFTLAWELCAGLALLGAAASGAAARVR